MFVSPLAPDDYEALLADIRLTKPSYATATDDVGSGMLPYQPQPCYNHVTSVEINPPSKSPIPRSALHQQDQYPHIRPRRRGVRYEPYHSRLNTNNEKEQYDQSGTMVRDPSDLVFPIAGAESDDVTGKQNGQNYPTSPENEDVKRDRKRECSHNRRKERSLDIKKIRVLLQLGAWMSENDVLYCRTSISHQL
jgi:hypothetical protein